MWFFLSRFYTSTKPHNVQAMVDVLLSTSQMDWLYQELSHSLLGYTCGTIVKLCLDYTCFTDIVERLRQALPKAIKKIDPGIIVMYNIQAVCEQESLMVSLRHQIHRKVKTIRITYPHLWNMLLLSSHRGKLPIAWREDFIATLLDTVLGNYAFRRAHCKRCHSDDTHKWPVCCEACSDQQCEECCQLCHFCQQLYLLCHKDGCSQKRCAKCERIVCRKCFIGVTTGSLNALYHGYCVQCFAKNKDILNTKYINCDTCDKSYHNPQMVVVVGHESSALFQE